MGILTIFESKIIIGLKNIFYVHNKFMNQILETKSKNYKLKNFLKIQFLISFITIIILFIYFLNENRIKNKEIQKTKIASQNAKIYSLFESYESQEDAITSENEIYFCTLKIEKINLEYFVYQNYSEELLKILPCKFFGGNLNENTNICIIAHNYFDDRFFGNLDSLEVGDEIILKDFQGKEYLYNVYDICEIKEKEFYDVVKPKTNQKLLTLCTCTKNKNVRLIVKAELRKVLENGI